MVGMPPPLSNKTISRRDGALKISSTYDQVEQRFHSHDLEIISKCPVGSSSPSLDKDDRTGTQGIPRIRVLTTPFY